MTIKRNLEKIDKKKYLSFWVWFIKGNYQAMPGWKRLLLSKSTSFTAIISLLVAIITEKPIEEIAVSLFLPLIGIFVGLSFAWVGNMLSLLHTPPAKKMAVKNEGSGGYRNYLFVLQCSVFVLLLTLIFWGLAGIGTFTPLENKGFALMYLLKSFLFFMLGLSITECWGIIQGTIWAHLVCDLEENPQNQEPHKGQRT